MLVEYEFCYQEQDRQSGILMIFIEKGVFSLSQSDATSEDSWHRDDVHSNLVWIADVNRPNDVRCVTSRQQHELLPVSTRPSAARPGFQLL